MARQLCDNSGQLSMRYGMPQGKRTVRITIVRAIGRLPHLSSQYVYQGHRRRAARLNTRFCAGARKSIEAEIVVAGKVDHGPLSNGGDGEKRIHADRARNDRPVADIEAAMHASAASVEHLA